MEKFKNLMDGSGFSHSSILQKMEETPKLTTDQKVHFRVNPSNQISIQSIRSSAYCYGGIMIDRLLDETVLDSGVLCWYASFYKES